MEDGRHVKFFLQKDLDPKIIEDLAEKITVSFLTCEVTMSSLSITLSVKWRARRGKGSHSGFHPY